MMVYIFTLTCQIWIELLKRNICIMITRTKCTVFYWIVF